MNISIHGSEKNPTDLAREWVIWNYGFNYDIDKYTVQSMNQYRFPLNVQLKETVENKKNKTVHTFTQKLKNVAYLTYDTETKVIKGPTNKDLASGIKSKIEHDQQFIERIIISSEHEQFGGLVLSRQMFTPIRKILIEIMEHEKANLHHYSSRMAHVDLLRRADFVEINNNQIFPTSRYTQLAKQLNGDFERLENCIVGYVLSEFYDYIVKDMRIWSIMNYPRIVASYYRPAKKAKELLWLDIDWIYESYNLMYPKMNRTNFDINLAELTRSDILIRENDSIYGHNSTLRNLISSQYINNQRCLDTHLPA